jgi:DNA-binding NtrC family response regulator
MAAYYWPGNVRQLINCVERAKILADNHLITCQELPDEVLSPAPRGERQAAARSDDLASIERNHVIEIMNREHGNKSRAARALGVNRRTLYRLLEKYNIPLNEGPSSAHE